MATSFRVYPREFSNPHEIGSPSPARQRMHDLKDACTLLADGFEEFDDLIEAYLQRVPMSARDTDNRDCDRFLHWLEDQTDLTLEQRDLLTNQQSRHAVEYVAIKQRIAHLRFREMVRENREFNKNSASHLSQHVHLNPVHVWATFETHAVLDAETDVPATVLFFATEEEIGTVVIDDATRSVLHDLEQGPQKLRTLIKQTAKDDREPLLATIAKLHAMEVLALTN